MTIYDQREDRPPCSVTGCDRRSRVKSLCHSHYESKRLYPDTPLKPFVLLTSREKFESRVNKTETCWLWTGAKSGGYGHIWLTGIGHRMAHRVNYEYHVGPIPEGLDLDHLCRVRACVNPSHLEPVTHQENVLRGEAPTAVNAAKVECVRGHAFTERNTYMSNGSRVCRTCTKLRAKKRNGKAAA